MITVITVTIGGRNHYLKKAIQSVKDSIGIEQIEHIILFNGLSPDDKILEFIDKDLRENYKPKYVTHALRVSIGRALNYIKSEIQGDLVMKMDDDCLIQSKDFFNHVRAINNLMPNAIFSPFPVGLIENLGGPPSIDRKVIYSKETDTFYTLRKVNHIGGFARIYPTRYAKNITFVGDEHDEDGQFSRQYSRLGMYYLENAIVVEHQESTLGQHERYGNTYFQGRF